ncbi:MAG: energy-coupling factor transporter transmembrane protein EcfT [Actinomycetota bacterium]|nr:energy-coupling factor transporter transmembrane protein EcfT [Actinomycetota bacterium]
MLSRLPRSLHPGAWWLWALGLATTASRTTNPLLLLLIIAVACLVVSARRPDAVWALGFRFYLYLGGIIVFMRVLFRVLFGGGLGPHVIVDLPQVPLPGWAAGITLLGPVSAESVLSGLYDGLRLATMLICLGAANSLANPKRLLKSVPSALYELGTAVVVALSVAPQLIESVLRVRRARRLRAGPQKGAGALRGIIIPVLEDALDRSRALAAAMDSRGYGSTSGVPRRNRRLTGGLVLGGLLGICTGVYGLLDGSTPRYLGAPMLGLGLTAAGIGLRASGQRAIRTRYRPDPWRDSEWLVAGSGGLACAVGFFAGSVDAINLVPSLYPLSWPQLLLISSIGVLVAALPAVLAPPPPAESAAARASTPPVAQEPLLSGGARR